MGKHRDEAGNLVKISCDGVTLGVPCDAEIHPNPRIAESGWVKQGFSEGGMTWTYDYCPVHAQHDGGEVR